MASPFEEPVGTSPQESGSSSKDARRGANASRCHTCQKMLGPTAMGILSLTVGPLGRSDRYESHPEPLATARLLERATHLREWLCPELISPAEPFAIPLRGANGSVSEDPISSHKSRTGPSLRGFHLLKDPVRRCITGPTTSANRGPLRPTKLRESSSFAPRGRYVVANPRDSHFDRVTQRAPTRRKWLPLKTAHRSGSSQGEAPAELRAAQPSRLAPLMKDHVHPLNGSSTSKS